MRRLALLLSLFVTVVFAPQRSEAGQCTYVVEKGDTVSHIARRHGVSEKNLIAANPALRKNPNRVRVGQKLKVCSAKVSQAGRPGKCGKDGRLIVHTVKRGDTVGAIAARYSVSRDSVRRFNRKLKKRANSMIRVGEKLNVCTQARKYTHRSWLEGGVHLSEGEGYNIRRPNNAWGTQLAIDGIVAAIETYTQREPEAPLVQVGDISRKNGGPLRRHKSHQEGRDVDIGVVWSEPHDKEEGKSLDIARTWSLVRSFAEAEGVRVIFIDYKLQKKLYEHALSIGMNEAWLDQIFEYPRKDGEAILYHWPGHSRHFHVRFTRGHGAKGDSNDVDIDEPVESVSDDEATTSAPNS
ncbi:MAG: penicillin-insensitive murein endopeptidase [Myxococcota bacterium]